MKLRLVYSGSQGGGCPTVYETDQGDNVVVQGDLLTDTEAPRRPEGRAARRERGAAATQGDPGSGEEND